MAPLPPQVEQYVEKADALLAKYPNLSQYERLIELEEKTGYSKVYFALAAVALFCSLILGVGGSKLVSDLVAVIYPAYMSFKVIDSSDPTDDKQWLTYWVVFGFISIVESCASFLVAWIPFYTPLKIAFFIWLWHPKFLGAGLVYTQVLRPFLLPYVGTTQKKQS